MNFNKEEIMSIVAEILGSEATGLYINEAIVHRDLSYEDVPLLSTVGAMPFAVEDIEGYSISYGMTKLCICPDNKHIDWVIKIPITGIYEEEYFDDDEDLSFTEDNDNFKEVKVVGKAISDVCDEELAIYENYSSDVKELMAKNYFIGEYNGIPIYVQERVFSCENECAVNYANYGEALDDFIMHEIDYLMEINSDIDDSDFAYNIIMHYGIIKAIEIYNEISDLDDMHKGNYGFNMKGKAMIFDYAGYSRDYYEFFAA